MNTKFLTIFIGGSHGVRYTKPMPEELQAQIEQNHIPIHSIFEEFAYVRKMCDPSKCEQCMWYFHYPQVCWFDVDYRCIYV